VVSMCEGEVVFRLLVEPWELVKFVFLVPLGFTKVDSILQLLPLVHKHLWLLLVYLNHLLLHLLQIVLFIVQLLFFILKLFLLFILHSRDIRGQEFVLSRLLLLMREEDPLAWPGLGLL
jgi:hypothetical protein